MEPIARENVNLKSSSTNYEENNSDGVSSVADQKDDGSTKKEKLNAFLILGEHEAQISEGGETDLHKHMANCQKNPGHKEFIPIESFSLEHLPEGLRDSVLYDFIKAAADLTVRIGATMTSLRRPEVWPNTNSPYPLSDMRGKKTLRTGTGRVCNVRKHTDEDRSFYFNYKPCPCEKCKASDNPSKVWWELFINTAAHVVFDATELAHATVRLFYDKEDSPKIILEGKVAIDAVDVIEDRCTITCVTCDENLGNKLEKSDKRFQDLWDKILDKYRNVRELNKFNFIVSHPHGCYKQVSVGRWENIAWKIVGENYTKFTYATCTCPGSSGAYVHFLGFYSHWSSDHVHSGKLNPELNTSGVGNVW